MKIELYEISIREIAKIMLIMQKKVLSATTESLIFVQNISENLYMTKRNAMQS